MDLLIFLVWIVIVGTFISLLNNRFGLINSIKSVVGRKFTKRRKKNKYIDFLLNNSSAIKELLALNAKYTFFIIEEYKEEHTYDNETFFETISCKDYLIYQLQFKKYKIEKQIQDCEYNKNKFNEYEKKVSSIVLGRFDLVDENFKIERLIKEEKEIFNSLKINCKTHFKAKVILKCSQINGRIYSIKEESFSAEEVRLLIKKLDNNNRGFYNDREIWDAICRVERGKVSNKMRFSIYKRDGYRCCICGRTERQDALEIDHIKPIAKGGKSTYDNLQTLCRRCNKEKGDKEY